MASEVQNTTGTQRWTILLVAMVIPSISWDFTHRVTRERQNLQNQSGRVSEDGALVKPIRFWKFCQVRTIITLSRNILEEDLENLGDRSEP